MRVPCACADLYAPEYVATMVGAMEAEDALVAEDSLFVYAASAAEPVADLLAVVYSKTAFDVALTDERNVADANDVNDDDNANVDNSVR